ncbi:MAG TPA: protein kinase, partial [Candidatus Paceibacterota bacterium]|nr:protein kinase [Candidatus Paceibacterota bacterium]
MTDPRREKEIFENALDLASVEERQRFVRQACGGDTDLLARVQGLLQALDQAEGFLAENLAAQGQETAPVEETTVPTGEREERHPLGPEDVGHRVGCYKLLQKIGEGGCGTVYMAEQLEPVRRRVALKIVKLGMDTRQVITRFEAERQALAVMDHPNIARILDAGATASGRPYFVMELVRGVRITQFCDERQLPLRERLGLFVQVCQAVQHAHQKGIIHRDIKPSNILVTLNDGVPMPKVIDFGIAKATQGNLTDKTLFTMFEHFIGTPAYMSPEQAEVRGVDIDTRSDIYSLGVVLYELLTGRTPFDSRALLQRGIEELILTLRQVEPPRPSTRVSTLAPADLQTVAQSQRCEVPRLVPALRGDLDWIVMKCLEKDRARRYDTANGLAADLQRHLVHEPVVARPPSTAYRVQKAWQRNRVAFTAGTLVASTLLVGAGVSTWQAIRATRARQAEAQQRFAAQYAENRARAEQREAERERQRAEASEARTSDLLYAANMNLAQAAFKENNFERTRQLLEVTSANPKRGFEWYYWQSQMHREARILRGHVGPVHSVGFAPDGRRLVTGGQDGWVIVWDASTGEERLRFHRDRGSEGIGLVAFSPDGERVLSSSGWDDRGLRIHHATTGAELLALSRVKGGSFSPDGRRIATIRGERVILWDSVTGQEVFSLKASSPFSDPFGQTVTFSPDGKSVLVPSMETVAGQHVGTEGLWDAATGEKKLTIREWTQVHAFSPDGRRVATMSKWGGNPPMIWDLANPDKPLGSLVGMLGQRASIKPSPDGGQWLTGGQNRTAQLWDATTFKELRTFRGHTGGIREVAFSADGQWIATASEDGTTRMWAVDAPDGPLVLRDPGLKEPQDAAVSPDGRWVASAHNTNAVIWDAATGRLVHKLRVYTRNPDRRREWAEDAVNTVSFSPDSQRVVAAGNNYVAIVFEVKTGQQLVTLDHSSADVSERSVRSATFSPDGRQIVTASADISRSGDFAKPLRIWDAATGQFLAAITENVHTIPDVW